MTTSLSRQPLLGDEEAAEIVKASSSAANGSLSDLTQAAAAANTISEKSSSIRRRKATYGVLIVLGVAVTWVGATQTSKSTYDSSFQAPFFNMWFSTCWFLLALPTYLAGVYTCQAWGTCHAKKRDSNTNNNNSNINTNNNKSSSDSSSSNTSIGSALGNDVATLQSSRAVLAAAASELLYGGRPAAGGSEAARRAATDYLYNGLPWLKLLRLALPFVVLWAGANYSYSRALMVISPTDVTAIFSATPAFVYVLSLLVLHHKFAWLPLMAVVVTIGGIVMVAMAERVEGISAEGVLLTLCAAACAAVYKVLLKLRVGDVGAGAVSVLLSAVALLNAGLLWGIWVALQSTGVENFSWTTIPWTYLCLSAALGLGFNFLINFGIAYTYPLFISLGTVLGIPLNAAFDAAVRGEAQPPLKLGGCALVIIGFCLLAAPNGGGGGKKKKSPR